MLRLLAISIFFAALINMCYAQDTVEQRNRLINDVTERFYALKANKDVKQGLYRALFKRNTVIAIGNYNQNKRKGTWRYSAPDGAVIQQFNYDNHKLLLETAQDSFRDVHILVDDTVRDCDELTRPVKPGGYFYGLIPYLKTFQLPFDAYNIDTNEFDAEIELLVSQGGRLAEYTVHISSDFYDYEQIFRLSVNLFDLDDRVFLPATLNGKAVVSRIVIDCMVTQSGGLDYE